MSNHKRCTTHILLVLITAALTTTVNADYDPILTYRTTVDSGYFASVAVDQQGRPIIAYRSTVLNKLCLATIDGKDYRIEPVTDSPNAGYYCDLAVTSTGDLGIAHATYEMGLAFSFKPSWAGTWITTSIDTYPSSMPRYSPCRIDLAFSNHDIPHIVYPGSDQIKHAYFNPQTNHWTTSTLTTYPAYKPRIAIDHNDNLAVTFLTPNYVSNITSMINYGSGWVQLPDLRGYDFAIAFAPDGRLAITYMDYLYLIVYRTFHQDIGWSEPVIIGQGSPYSEYTFLNLAFDANGHPFILYPARDYVQLATCITGWANTPTFIPARSPAFSMTFDHNNQPLAAYNHNDFVYLTGAGLARPDVCDFDKSGVIDLHDYAFFADLWARQKIQTPGDLNGDGEFDTLDIALFAENWLWKRHYLD